MTEPEIQHYAEDVLHNIHRGIPCINLAYRMNQQGHSRAEFEAVRDLLDAWTASHSENSREPVSSAYPRDGLLAAVG